MHPALLHSRASWNRDKLDLASDEVLAQILDRGELDAWRALYQIATVDPALRARIVRMVQTVPLPLPRFWQAAMAALGEPVDHDAPVPAFDEGL